jgi:hypothetical protein
MTWYCARVASLLGWRAHLCGGIHALQIVLIVLRKRRRQKFVDVGIMPVALHLSFFLSFFTYLITFKVLLRIQELNLSVKYH